MMPTEAVHLAGYIRAHFPSQPIDDYTADALGELLQPYYLETCRQAVLRLAMRNHEGDVGKSKWCTPTDVFAEVKRERAKRIVDHDPIDPPPGADPDDTAGHAAWLGRMRRAIADGATIPTRPAISGPARSVVGELGQIGQSIESPASAAREAHAAAKRQLQEEAAARKAERAQRQAHLDAMRAAELAPPADQEEVA